MTPITNRVLHPRGRRQALGDAIKTDISAAGKYIVKITAVDGHYKDGVVYLPFDIEARKLDDKVMVDGNNYATYNAEVHTFKFFVDNDSNGYYSNGDEKLYEGTDYTVYYVLDETDASEDSKVDVKNVGTYRAVIKGMGDYAGTVELSQDIVINPLDLATAPIEGIVSTSDHRPENPFYIWIDGVRYGEGSAIMGELKSEFVSSNTGDSMWFDGGEYIYKVSSKIGATDPNIKNYKTYTAYKVGTEVSFLYGGEALPESVDIYKNDPKTGWDANAVTGFAADGTMDGAEVDKNHIVQTVYNVNGGDVTGTNWQDVAGKYTIVIKYAPSDGSIGGIASVDVNVYEEAVNADAQAAVLYDADGDNAKDVVTSIEKVYDGINTLRQLEVVV